MDEDAAAGRPFIASLAIGSETGGCPAPWFFAKAREAGRLPASCGYLEAFAFHAKEMVRAVSCYREMSSKAAAALSGGMVGPHNKGLKMMLTARDIMTVDVISVESDCTVAAAADILVTHGISAVPVVEGERLVGIISEGDLMRRAEIGTGALAHSWWSSFVRGNASLAAEYTRAHSSHVTDLMTRDVAAVAEATPLTAIADLLEHRKIKRVPVVRYGKLIGIVSRADIIRALALTANLVPDASNADDRSIHRQIEECLCAEAWPSAGAGYFIVRDGIVSLWGAVLSEEERKAGIVLCENVPGVQRVEDHRTLLEFPVIAV